jgi:transposase
MYIETVRNRNSPPAILLRESFREDGRVRKRTLANLTHFPPAILDGLRALLRGDTTVGALSDSFQITRSLPHGHIAAVLGTLRRIGLDSVLGSESTRSRDLAIAMIVARVIDPRSKLATARGLRADTKLSTLSEVLGVESAGEDELYRAMDWLVEQQQSIEAALAQRHLADGALVLYDVTSTYFEGKKCPLARVGYSRDGKKNSLQIVIGLLCNAEGCPVAVEVFDGNYADPSTFGDQVEKVRTRFGLQRVVFVGDRGMITESRIREDLRGVPGLQWITALRSTAIRSLVDEGTIQLSLFDEKNLVEVTSDDFPGERLIVCKNPLLAKDRTRTRLELLQATEKELNKIAIATQRQNKPLRGKDTIALRVGKVLGRFKMAKHFELTITDDSFAFTRNESKIAAESDLDGLYVVRTTVSPDTFDSADAVHAYKRLAVVERAFRSFKTVDLRIRPVFHHLESRVRAHVFICMLAYYVEWHMRKALAPLLFDDEYPELGHKKRASAVDPAQRSDDAITKCRTRRNLQGLPVHSFRTLLADLATISKNRIQSTQPHPVSFDKTTAPTPIQHEALRLLNVTLDL